MNGALRNYRWLSLVLSLAAGVLAAAVFPPFGFLPGLLGYGLLMALWDTANEAKPLKSAFWRGWLAGTAFFFIAMWWVYEAFQVDAKDQGWMAPFAVALLASGLGLFWGAAGLLYRWLAPKGPVRVLVFTGVFCLLEWVRGHILTGLPWDLAGESWRAGSAPSQAAAIVGAYGLSWITVASVTALTLVFDRQDRRRERIGAAVGAAALVGLYAFGMVRLASSVPTPPDAPVVRVVQTNDPEQPAYDMAAFRRIFGHYIALTSQPGGGRAPDVVIWPEGAIPDSVNDYLAPGTWTRAAIDDALQPGQSLLTGGYRATGPARAPAYFNTVVVMRKTGAGLGLTALYDKFRLVPFGEYMPLDSVMGRIGFKQLVHVGDGFSVGPRPAPIHPAGLPPVQPLICYESLFPGLAHPLGKFGGGSRGDRAAWIVNVSDGRLVRPHLWPAAAFEPGQLPGH